MGDEERDILAEQHAAILDKLSTVESEVAMAKGAFWATGYLGGALIVVISGIALYAFNKIELHGIAISQHESRISVIEGRFDLIDNANYKE